MSCILATVTLTVSLSRNNFHKKFYTPSDCLKTHYFGCCNSYKKEQQFSVCSWYLTSDICRFPRRSLTFRSCVQYPSYDVVLVPSIAKTHKSFMLT